MKSELRVATFGIAVIGVLQTIAFGFGIDGTMYGASMAGIGAIVGWVFKSVKSGGGVL